MKFTTKDENEPEVVLDIERRSDGTAIVTANGYGVIKFKSDGTVYMVGQLPAFLGFKTNLRGEIGLAAEEG